MEVRRARQRPGANTARQSCSMFQLATLVNGTPVLEQFVSFFAKPLCKMQLCSASVGTSGSACAGSKAWCFHSEIAQFDGLLDGSARLVCCRLSLQWFLECVPARLRSYTSNESAERGDSRGYSTKGCWCARGAGSFAGLPKCREMMTKKVSSARPCWARTVPQGAPAHISAAGTPAEGSLGAQALCLRSTDARGDVAGRCDIPRQSSILVRDYWTARCPGHRHGDRSQCG